MISKKPYKMSHDLKEKNWEMLETSSGKEDQFRRTMPLIQNLKDTAMRRATGSPSRRRWCAPPTTSLTKQQRPETVTLVTTEVHVRDTLKKLVEGEVVDTLPQCSGCRSCTSTRTVRSTAAWCARPMRSSSTATSTEVTRATSSSHRLYDAEHGAAPAPRPLLLSMKDIEAKLKAVVQDRSGHTCNPAPLKARAS